MRIHFHGADRQVTGSCHLVACGGRKILVDCGLFQGRGELDEENRRPFGFDPADIDYLLLTHAHLDHCGRIPLLEKAGFRGEIITTAATRELTRLVLLDAARLQEEEAERRARQAARRRGRPVAPEPLYTTLDALNCLDRFGRTAGYGGELTLDGGVRVSFHDAGHILGSASILLEVREGGRSRRVLFSGDLGYGGRPILRDPRPPCDVDAVVLETTYGDRRHKALEPSLEELYGAIAETLDRGGNVVIPTFALERAQEILFYLRQAVETHRLPRSLQVFLDSPMAITATEIFRRHPECYDAETAALFEGGRDPFALPNLHFTRETAQSMALNQIHSGAVIMAGSGMCTGGRVRHHLKHNLWRPECAVIFVGYAAQGTLARLIIDGAKRVRIFGEEIPVRARIHTIGGFSAHADARELLQWLEAASRPRRVFLVHGEEHAMGAFARHLHAAEVSMPQMGESFEV